MASQPVDQLEIKVVVDNVIEWFHPVPAGFMLEPMLQLTSGPPLDDKGVPVLDLPNYCCGAHGLSLLLTTTRNGKKSTILFDAGPDGRALERNVAALKLDMSSVERVVLSHWHSDHSGGLLKALELIKSNGSVAVDLHPDRPELRGIAPPPAWKLMAGLPADPTFDELTSAGGTIDLHGEAHTISQAGVYVSGEIPRLTAYEIGLIGGTQLINGEWQREPGQLVMDERYLCVDVKDKGLCIFSSCSHAGIINVVMDAKKQYPDRPVHLVMGGFHLGGRENTDRIAPTVEAFVNEVKATYVVPLHCTGHLAKVALSNALGYEHYIPGGVGMNVVI